MTKIIRKFPKADLFEVLDLNVGETHDGYTLVETKMIGTRRWSIDHAMVFGFEDKFYRANYSAGATEQQDEGPWEYDGDEIECVQVEPHSVTTTVYKLVKAAE